jgi:hypothetical protein
MVKKSETKYLAALNRLKAGKPAVVTGEYEINLDTIAAECGLKRGSIRRDRLSDEFKATLDESVAAREETLSQEPKSKLKMANEECRKLREKVKQLQAELDRSVAREMNLSFELLNIKKSARSRL